MFVVDQLILLGGILLLFGIVSSKFSARLGMPVLVLFVAVGMLAGSEGLGQIAFDDYPLAHGIGTLALVVILFDGGLRTSVDSFRAALKPASLLASLGVVLTAAITGAAAAWVLGLPMLYGLLLGSIVGSTDAAVVFSVLRNSGIKVRPKLADTLEVESGSNDPMAVFLTIGVAQIILGDLEPGLPLLGFLLQQAAIGGLVGYVAGKASAWLNNRINLAAAGLYPILTAACALLAYGAAATLGGSGILAVYIAGIVLGNSRIVFHHGIFLFTDGMAWLSQIVMFVVLGLLSNPSDVFAATVPGLVISAVLMFLARPAAVFLLLAPFSYTLRELLLISWVGLKGSVPIILATYPLIMGVPQATLLFNVVFFVVLVSALTQGWSLPLVANALKLTVPSEPEAPVSLEITSLKHIDGDIVEYLVTPESRAANRLVRDLALPDGVVVSMIAREQRIIPPRGSTRVLPGDYLFLVMRPGVRLLVNRIFGPRPTSQEDGRIEFPLDPATTVGELEDFYGVHLERPPSLTISELLAQHAAPREPEPDTALDLGSVVLHVRGVRQGEITAVGLEIRTNGDAA